MPYLRFCVFKLDADDVVAVLPEHRYEGLRGGGGGVHGGGAEEEAPPEGGTGVNGGVEVWAGRGDVSESVVRQEPEDLHQGTFGGELEESEGLDYGGHGSEIVSAELCRYVRPLRVSALLCSLIWFAC